MSPFARFMLAGAAFAALLALGSGLLLAYVVDHSGLVTVELREHAHGGRWRLLVPAGLLAGAADLAAFAGAREERQCRRLAAARAWHAWRPAARAACRTLAAGPDGVLVDVEGGPGNVRVVKRGDTVEVQVHGPGGDVRVTTPARLVWRLAGVV